MRKNFFVFLIAHIFILLFLFLSNNDFSILSYINVSFAVGGGLVFISLVSYIFSTGFFDIFIKTSRKVFTRKHRMEDVMSMRLPSEIFTGSVSPLLGGGILVFATMLIALIIYYI